MTATEHRLDVDRLLVFFGDHGRDLPWRRPEAGPWGVMVSEFMLQQTPVVRVLPVFEAWMRRWPRPADLAADSSGDAVRAWGRLGYPRRALRLHAAATAITNDHDGAVPSDIPELLSLPGVGEYTARAIAAFAFGARTPVVDTNVRRVLSRVVRGVDSVREPATPADRRELESLLPTESVRAARFSAAVMELGALICSAGDPDCDRCPLSGRCAWRAAGYPPTPARRAVQAFAGTDRQVRGKIMALLRAAHGPVAGSVIDTAWPDPIQRDRCVASLITDGLAVTDRDGGLSLPG
ncbi:A/G-specific DNA-adenine glycosylase [Nakamurella panacisegetis]|uniref:Adenine DNA glycosylase n=1 Tax=Nakamurella panacisegetis TaxID=1090615 RepID=A0A1H0NPW4_9ACTN|nr:A/G-specific adenine glycosylase [Nakamurella panacisegetis]SDO94683.1 A/G-specific DNA-adenine glycosylase [Nakamurella panacisegetis]